MRAAASACRQAPSVWAWSRVMIVVVWGFGVSSGTVEGRLDGMVQAGKPVASPALVGRAAEFDRLVDALAHPPALAFVEGEPGIGKTRLLRECLGSLDLADRVVLVAACPPLTEPFPLGPIVQGIRRLRSEIGDLELSPLAGALRPLFPEWSDQLPPALEALGDPAETRHRLLRAVSELVDRLGVEVLVVEDGHWADAATLEWLLTVATADDLTMSVVVTYRPTDVPAGSLLPRLTSRAVSGVSRVRVELAPLDVADARRLVGSMLGTDEVSQEFGVFLHERTDGVPLALEETIRLMRERHDVIHQHGSWTRKALEELRVPPTLRDSVLERVDRLDPLARAVLQAAAVLAEPADQPLLAKVADLDDQSGGRAVAAALVSGLLCEADGGRLIFRHVLDAQAVAEAIPASHRWALHRRAAEHLRRLEPEPVTRLARHFREAGDVDAWCQYGEASADLASETGDDHTAVPLLLEVLTSVEHPTDRRGRLALKLARAVLSGSAPPAEHGPKVCDALRQVLARGDLPAGVRGEIRTLLGRLLLQLGEFDAAATELEAALADLAARPGVAARVMLSLAWPELRAWSGSQSREWLARATALLPRIEPASERLGCMIMRADLLLLIGDESGWDAVNDIPTSAQERDARRYIALGMINVAQVAVLWGRYGEVGQRLAAGDELVRADGFAQMKHDVRVAHAHLAWCTGAWEGLAATVGELATLEETQPGDRVEAQLIEGLLSLAAGSGGGAQARLREVQADMDRRGQVSPFVLPSAGLARIALADGRSAEAVRVTGPDMDLIAAKGVWLWATDIAPVHLDALIGVGELAQAESLVDRFAAGLGGVDAPAPQAALVACRAILAEANGDADAATLFAQAADAWAALPRPYDELLALERQGRCLLAGDQLEAAITVLSDVEQRLRGLGAKWDADRVAHLLREHGVEVARSWRGGRRSYGDQLSPRELEVVELVAQGRTNMQIADVLFISPRTVTKHLSTSMRKLKVSSRTALAITATQTGLLSGDTPDRRSR